MTITLITHPLTEAERKANQKALAKHLLERKKQAQEEMLEEYRTNPRIKKIFEELQQQNEVTNVL
jgi:hypothetical protein